MSDNEKMAGAPDELEARVASVLQEVYGDEQSQPARQQASAVKTFGFVPDRVYDRHKFGPAGTDTEGPLYVLLSDYQDMRAKLSELVSAVRSINYGPAHEIQRQGDDDPCYLQRKEWIEWLLGLCAVASAQPNASIERDERVEHEAFSQACREAALAKGRNLDPLALERRPNGSHVNALVECGWWGWRTRAALAVSPPPAAQAYRLLTRDDVIEHTDECLADNAVTWLPLGRDLFVGRPYNPCVMAPIRRPVLQGLQVA